MNWTETRRRVEQAEQTALDALSRSPNVADQKVAELRSIVTDAGAGEALIVAVEIIADQKVNLTAVEYKQLYDLARELRDPDLTAALQAIDVA